MLRQKFFVPMGGFFLVLLAMLAWPQAVEARPVKPDYCASIGVRVGPMTRPFAEALGMTEPYGAVFGRPRPGSPAAHAGIEAGDVVTEINGKPLASSKDFAPAIDALAPGTTVYLSTRRSNQLLHVPVHLGWGKCRGGGQGKRATHST